MARSHGKHTQILVDGDDLSAFINNSELTRTGDTHDVTTYGKNDYVFDGGLKGGKFTFGGVYDDGATGPSAVLVPLIATTVEVIRKPEGTGSGKPLETFDVVLNNYVETNPVAGFVSWTAECTVSDAVVTTTQGA